MVQSPTSKNTARLARTVIQKGNGFAKMATPDIKRMYEQETKSLDMKRMIQSQTDRYLNSLRDAGVKSDIVGNIRSNMPKPVQGVLNVSDILLPPKLRINTENVMGAFKGRPVDVTPPKYSSGNNNDSYGLSKAPNPKPVSLNSGIIPNAYANDYMAPVINGCSPMQMVIGELGIPQQTTHAMQQYFVNSIAFDIQTRAQSNVGFSLDITTVLTSTNLLSAFNSVITALQIYYYYSSILSYESDSRNKNTAMIYLRKQMTSQIISDLVQLGRRLEDTPIPPRIVEWVRYMNMNYLSGNTQGAPLLKLCPGIDILRGTGTPIATALNALTTSTNTNVFTLIRRSIPQWRVGKLYDVPQIPVYDKNFVTIFSNAPTSYADSAAAIRNWPSGTSTVTNFPYNSFVNKLDGGAFAMGGIYLTGPALWYPGLLTPVQNGTNTSKQSFYSNAGVDNFYNSQDYPFLVLSRQDTSYLANTLAATTVIYPHLLGAERVLGVSGDSMFQTARNYVDFLFNVESIPVKGTLSGFNRRGNNQI